MNANGSRDTANRYFIDGIEFMDYDAMTYSFSPSVDSLAEFKVRNQQLRRRRGGAPGGQVNMLTKRGGKVYHGTLWEFNRNDALTQTYDAIAGQSVDSARLNRNQFGANIGGPVSIPKLYTGKDRDVLLLQLGIRPPGAGCFARIPHRSDGGAAQRRLRGLVDARTRQPIVLPRSAERRHRRQRDPASPLSQEALAFLDYEPLPNTQNGMFNFLSPVQCGFETGQLHRPCRSQLRHQGPDLRPLYLQRHLRGRSALLGQRRAQQSGPHPELGGLLDRTSLPVARQRVRTAGTSSANSKSSARPTNPSSTSSER